MMSFFRKVATPKNVSQATSAMSNAEMALNEVKELWKTGQLKEALSKINMIEEQYPSCTKAAKHYRGKIGIELLEKNGDLPIQHKL